MNAALASLLDEHNRSVGMHGVHLPDGWLLNARRVPVPPTSCHGRERLDEIHSWAILLQDLSEDPSFAMDSS
jgi:hypothetical protein